MRNALGLALVVTVLAACTGGSPEAEASPTEPASEAASPSPSASPSEAASAGVAPLGVAAGHYVAEAENCGSPTTVLFYDGKRIAYMYAGLPASDGFPAEPGVGAESVAPIGPVSRESGGFYLSDWEMIVMVLGPERIRLEIQDTGPPMRLCPAGQVPAALRVR